MIRCIPRGVCSWNFDLSGDGHQAFAEFRWMSEQGSLLIDQEPHEISKAGPFSGSWSLSSGGGVLLTAQKTSAFRRSFEITGQEGVTLLKAESIFGRTMSLQGPYTDCLISTDHPFTRRSSITGQWQDFKLVSFAFWLAALTWRRASKNNSGAVGQ